MRLHKIKLYSVLAICMFILSAYFSTMFQYYTIKKAFSYNPIDYIPVIQEHGFSWSGTMIIFAVFMGLFIYLGLVNRNTVKEDARKFNYSNSGVYGTAGLLSEKDIEGYAFVQTPNKARGTILGQVDGSGTKLINTDMKSRMNKHVAVYGASGSGKSRGYARPFIIQCVKRRESVIVTDPKGELYESTAQYLKDNGYVVKVFDLVHPERSDGWNCLKELRGDELRAQILSSVIVENTNGGKKGNDVWDNSAMSLLKALVLRVERGKDFQAKHQQSIGDAYQLIQNPDGEQYLDTMFDPTMIDKESSICVGPYMTFKQASDNMRGNIITSLAVKMQVFQNNIIRRITALDDIDLTLPAKIPCAYFCIMSDQHQALNFLSTLFFSFCFIDQVEYADLQPNKRCNVPVNYLLDEFPNIGSIPDFDKKIATVRSRDINISLIFQSIGQLQNRYPNGIWSSILANCDTHLMLGCNDEDTAKFISDRSGETTVKVQTVQHPKYENLLTLRHQKSSGDGKRKILNPDEVMRLPMNEVIIIFRGLNVWKTYKYDFEMHPEAKKFKNISILDKPKITDELAREEYNIQEKKRLKQWAEKHNKEDEYEVYKSVYSSKDDVIINNEIESDNEDQDNVVIIESSDIEPIEDNSYSEFDISKARKRNNRITDKDISDFMGDWSTAHKK